MCVCVCKSLNTREKLFVSVGEKYIADDKTTFRRENIQIIVAYSDVFYVGLFICISEFNELLQRSTYKFSRQSMLRR